MVEKAGNLPARGAVIAALVVPILAAAAAWGAADSRLAEFDRKNVEMKQATYELAKELRSTREEIVQLRAYLRGAGIISK